MTFKFKTPSEKTKDAMANLILNNDNETDYNDICESKIKDITKHKYAKLTNSGNGAIYLALSSLEGPIIIPDQGAWHGFKQISKLLNKETISLKTEQGLIKEEYLEKIVKEHNKNLNLILTSFAAYTAEQDMKNISKFCKDNNITIIEDASAGIGDKKKKLANSKYSDIIIASTGSPKLINVENGGFLATSNYEFLEKTKIQEKLVKTNEITACGINVEIDLVEKHLTDTINACSYLKNELENVIHQNKRGVNVIISTDNPKEFSWQLKKELPINKKSFISKCPNYNRLKEKAVAIEIKNLSYENLKKENLDLIIEKVNNQQLI